MIFAEGAQVSRGAPTAGQLYRQHWPGRRTCRVKSRGLFRAVGGGCGRGLLRPVRDRRETQARKAANCRGRKQWIPNMRLRVTLTLDLPDSSGDLLRLEFSLDSGPPPDYLVDPLPSRLLLAILQVLIDERKAVLVGSE